MKELNLYIDERGTLHIGGRLKHATIPYDSKHQISQPNKHHICELIVRNIHNGEHMGTEYVHLILRQKYWIVKIIVRALRSEHFNHFDQKVWYPQSVDILVLYIRSSFLRLHCSTIMLQTKSKLKFWCNISTNFGLGENFWKMLKYFNNFEYPDIWSNLGENCLISCRDSNKKRIYGTRNNKKRLMTCPFFSYFNKFEHPDISSNLEENCLISFRDSNKKQTYGTRNNKKSLIVCSFLLYYFNNFEHYF